MGAIKATELANGNIGLEITYGGKESPFGGVDTSAPPAYIDPKCFTQCDGFIVVNGTLTAASLRSVTIPVLWNSTAGVTLIGFGNFYSPKFGTLNYALGYTASAVTGTPTGVTYTFYMTSWSPSSITAVWDDTLVYTLYNSLTPATAASITTALQTTSIATPGSGAVIEVASVTSLGSSDTSALGGGYFDLTGIPVTLTITTPGLNYVVGTTYWLVQGSNITAQVTITGVGAGGSITALELLPSSYTTQASNANNSTPNLGTVVTELISVAGWGYSIGPASLYYSVQSNVVLDIKGPAGEAEYAVISNGATMIDPGSVGSGGVAVAMAYNDNGVYKEFAGWSYTTITGTIVLAGMTDISSSSYPNPTGTGYSVGEVYYLDMPYVDATVSQVNSAGNYTSFLTNPPTTVKEGTAQVLVAAIGAGGSIAKLVILNSGLDSDGYGTINTSNAPGDTFIGYQSGIFVLTRPVPVLTITGSVSDILNTMANEINGTADAPYNIADLNVTATVNTLASSLTLTAIIPGTVGNSISVQDLSTITGPDLYYYYFPVRTLTYLTGGDDGTGVGTTLSTLLPSQASIASVGGTLYIGNIGPAIIKFSGHGEFVVSTTSQGVRVLRKFAGSLIGLGLVPTPGTIVDSVDMILAWSAANALDVWAPLNLAGNITGAGYEMLADIGDYLTGLIVTNATAFIVRSRGVSYATATGNATSPFTISHIELGDEGEGAQIKALVCQYGQMGCYVGNSDVYQLSNSFTAIGEKIKKQLFSTLLDNPYSLYGAAACAIYIIDEIPVVVFIVGTTFFIYNTVSRAWQTATLTIPAVDIQYLLAGVFATTNTTALVNLYNQDLLTVVVEVAGKYSFYSYEAGIPSSQLSTSKPSTVIFPVEEVSFGRDVTIDALYVSVVAQLAEDVTLTFSFGDVLFGQLILKVADYTSMNVPPIESQVFPLNSTPGAVTVRAPQLKVELSQTTSILSSQLSIAKIATFASYDSKQRPV